MSDIIKLLPDSVANQIAAGEVIQRPSSVVKELMENSVDSGAGTITVIIRDSGKTLIQVADDGTGMSETDARLAFERHATSKISSAFDLFSIKTKGFRGEALASIAAVAMVELKTRRETDEAGTLVVISGSKVETQEPCSCPKGSSLAVKNLFFNIPARRKFLKSDTTEMRHIISEFEKVVIAHPEIRFSLIHNDSEIYNLGQSNLRQRIIGVFGKQINQDLISIDTETTLIKIKGFVGKPESARRTYGEQFFFVNNRFMKHPYLHKAVSEAYQNIIPADSIPTYFIFLEADPASIDVNIHPTKTEIKFEDERAIWQILMASVREALGRFNIVPSIDFESEALIDIPVKTNSDQIPHQPDIRINPGYNPFDNDSSQYQRPVFSGGFEKENTGNWEKLYTGLNSDKGNIEYFPKQENSRKFFQIRGRYIVCPVKSGLMLIDQRRAHERILYEKYLNSIINGDPSSQTELYPVTIELNPSDCQALSEIREELNILGFNFEISDNCGVTITGRPSDSLSVLPEELLRNIIEEFKSKQVTPLESRPEKAAASMASASAIPYGKPLAQMEMENLFDTLFACAAPNYSPTGKPVISIITIEDLEKRFI